MRAIAVAVLVPIFSGLIVAIAGMYTDVQVLMAKEPVRIKQLDRMERKIDKLIDYQLQLKDGNILKRGKDAKEGR